MSSSNLPGYALKTTRNVAFYQHIGTEKQLPPIVIYDEPNRESLNAFAEVRSTIDRGELRLESTEEMSDVLVGARSCWKQSSLTVSRKI